MGDALKTRGIKFWDLVVVCRSYQNLWLHAWCQKESLWDAVLKVGFAVSGGEGLNCNCFSHGMEMIANVLCYATNRHIDQTIHR